MVGSDSQKFMIKNSWEGARGSGGYIYMARNHHDRKLYSHSAVITLSGSAPDPGPDPRQTQAAGAHRVAMCQCEQRVTSLYVQISASQLHEDDAKLLINTRNYW